MDTQKSQTPAVGGKNASVSAVVAGAAAAGFIANMDDILSSSRSRTSGGTKIRASVGYTLVPAGVVKMTGASIPDQQKVILRIINKALTTEKPIISEPELHKLIVAAHGSGELKTKQEPWHIFRYYRTALVKAGAMREVAIQGQLEEKKAA